jgi:hypothetical protein
MSLKLSTACKLLLASSIDEQQLRCGEELLLEYLKDYKAVCPPNQPYDIDSQLIDIWRGIDET